MTIRLLRQWNGYEDGDIATLTGSEESRLVGLGLATYAAEVIGSPSTLGADLVPATQVTRGTPVRIVMFGDSAANIGDISKTDGINYDQYYEAAVVTHQVSGILDMILDPTKTTISRKYPLAQIVGNCGISGQNTTQMLARDALAASSTRRAATDLLAMNPHVVIYRGQSINDLYAGSTVNAGNWKSVANAVFVNDIAIVERLLQSGAYVFFETIFAMGLADGTEGVAVTTAATADPASVRLAINYLHDLAVSRYSGNKKVNVLSSVGILRSSDGRFLNNCSVDGVHLSLHGDNMWAEYESVVLQGIFGKSSNIRYPGASIFPDPLMLTQTAGVCNSIAIAFSGSGATIANKKTEVINNINMQTSELTLSNVACSLTYTFTHPSIANNYPANTIYGIEYDYYIESVNGEVLKQLTFTARVDSTKTGQGRTLIDIVKTTNCGDLTNSLSGKLVIPPFKMVEPSSGLATFIISFSIGATGTAGEVLKVGVSAPRIVPGLSLNQLQNPNALV